MFAEEDGIHLTPEMAQEALNNMAGLFLACGARRHGAIKSEVAAAPQREIIDSIPTT